MALDSANVGIWILDSVSRKFLPSNRSKILFGFLPEEEISFEDALLKVPDKNRRSVVAAVEKAIKSRSNLYIECPVNISSEKNSAGSPA